MRRQVGQFLRLGLFLFDGRGILQHIYDVLIRYDCGEGANFPHFARIFSHISR